MSSPDPKLPDGVALVPLNDDVPKTVTAIIGGNKDDTSGLGIKQQQKPPRPTIGTTGSYDSIAALSGSAKAGPRGSGKDTPRSGSSTPVGTSFKKGGKGHIKNKLSTQIPYIPAAEPTLVASTTSEDGSVAAIANDRLKLGICATDKKARSKPMAEILSRLDASLFQVVFFGDDMILNKDVEDWPVCDVLIAFYSKGYPLDKARSYVELRKPFILNDLEKQELLKDRRRVYDLLEASGIDVPRHVFLSKDDYVSTGSGDGNGTRDREVQEFDDHIEANGVVIHKPFVEKVKFCLKVHASDFSMYDLMLSTNSRRNPDLLFFTIPPTSYESLSTPMITTLQFTIQPRQEVDAKSYSVRLVINHQNFILISTKYDEMGHTSTKNSLRRRVLMLRCTQLDQNMDTRKHANHQL